MAEARETRVRPMMPEEIRQEEARAQADIQAEVAERDSMNGPTGGQYMVGDQMVDAEGKPVKKGKGD